MWQKLQQNSGDDLMKQDLRDEMLELIIITNNFDGSSTNENDDDDALY